MTDFVDTTQGYRFQPVGVARLAGSAAGLLLLQACATDQPPKPAVSKGPAVVTEDPSATILIDPLGSALVSVWVYQKTHHNVRIVQEGKREAVRASSCERA